ncbi:MAG: hypothetical protein WCW26_01060 [Candidatus Buchananbacteria bacterium]
MKYTIVVTIVVVLMSSAWAKPLAENKDPAKLIAPIQVGDKLTLRLWGFAQGAFIENAQPDEVQWTNLRLLGNLDGQRLGLGFVLNFADLQEPEGNWLRELYGKVELTDTLELRFGWLLTSVGNGNGEGFPGPPTSNTVLFPKSLPFGQYGTGLQLRWKNELWSVVADVTGDTSLPFDNPGRFENLEFSGRIKRAFWDFEREVGYLGGAVQLTKTVNRFGLDGQWQPIKPLTLRGGIFYSDYDSQKTSNRLGGFFQPAYRPVSWFEAHTMIDCNADLPKEYEELQKGKDKQGNVTYQNVTRQTSDDTIIAWTNGIRFLGKNDRWSVTLDYETAVEGKQPNRALARFQIRF